MKSERSKSLAGVVDPVLRNGVLEQVMRLSGDEFYALLVAAADDYKALRSAVGQLLGSAPTPMSFGSPLLALSGYCAVHDDWRKACPARPDSLWAHLEFYKELGHVLDESSPLAALQAARDRANASIDVN